MNVKINQEDHDRLSKCRFKQFLFGSRLFGTHNGDSDYDYIRIYNFRDAFPGEVTSHLPNIHSFQFDDTKNNSQYVWMTQKQFWGNLYSGDGTMQSDVVMFSGTYEEDEILNMCRTYKIIKAYCGVAKRDVQLHGKDRKKRFHAERSLYIADCLIKNVVPNIETIQTLKGDTTETYLLVLAKELRAEASRMYERKELHNYNINNTKDDLLNKMFEANNIREFKY